MNYNDFYLIVNEIKKNKPIWFGLESDPKATDLEIKEVEILLSVKLPDEYKKFIKNFGGGYFAFSNIFSVNKESEWYIVNQNKNIGLFDTLGFLAISDNEVGDYYGFKIENRVCGSSIHFYDHEINFLEITEYKNLYEFIIKVGLTLN